MTTRVPELFILLVSLLKWFVLASLVGSIVGVSTTLFLTILDASLALTQTFPYAFLLLPIGLTISAWITTRIAPETQGHGTERVVQAIHQRGGVINAKIIPAKLVATIVTVASGGSAGNIGPCAQIGSGLSSLLAQLIRFDDIDHKRLVICGISAGFAAVLGTPLAGALFGAEVLFIGRLYYGVLFPSLVSAFVGYHVASALGVTYLSPTLTSVPAFSLSLFLFVGLAGIIFGLGAVMFIEILKTGKTLSSLTGPKGLLTGLVGGISLTAIAVVSSDQFFSLGWTTVSDALQGESMLWHAFFLKAVTTSLTLNFGGSGGIVLPICFVGATLGSVFAETLNLDLATFAALGLVSLLAGTTNTPITALVLAMEMFGPELAPYAGLTCAISYVLSGHRSAIPTQILQESKSPSIAIDSIQGVEDVSWTHKPRNKTLTNMILKRWFQKKIPPE